MCLFLILKITLHYLIYIFLVFTQRVKIFLIVIFYFSIYLASHILQLAKACLAKRPDRYTSCRFANMMIFLRYSAFEK
ncbi:hypothetical protein ACJX0J_024289, partial [Zea mays]